MSKQSKSQWDFGELFPTEATRKVLSVSELTTQIKRLLEKQVGQIWVSGEITNLRAQASGHIYFTLKDAASQLSCVLFRGEAGAQREFLKDGQKVLLQGDVTVYEARGQYQLLVRAIELQGIGALQVKFEQLKQRLAAEGLFTPERKRPLPNFPQRLGLVTSPTGAAIRDVLHVVQRRNPSLQIILAPCRVQGEGAAGEIAEAIRMLNQFSEGRVTRVPDLETPGAWETRAIPRSRKVDLILVTRGGGSLEDLWAFNEEVVARAIFDSALPVVSAVGHEIDFTISDFVADFRAATPSAAAEIITEDVFASRQFVADAPAIMRQRLGQRIERELDALDATVARMLRAHPRRRLNDGLQRLDDLQDGLWRSVKSRLRTETVNWNHLASRLVRLRPAQALKQRREILLTEMRRLHDLSAARLRDLANSHCAAAGRLRLLGPEQVLGRGYSLTTDAATGRILRDAAKVKTGQKLRTRLKSGVLRSVVES